MGLRDVARARWGAEVRNDSSLQSTPNVSAPTGSLRAKLQSKRQGKDAYGTIPSVTAQHPLEIAQLLAMPLMMGSGAASTPAMAAKQSAGDMLRNVGMQMATNPAARSWIQNYMLAKLGIAQANAQAEQNSKPSSPPSSQPSPK